MPKDHSVPSACINIWYYVGSKDEADRRKAARDREIERERAALTGRPAGASVILIDRQRGEFIAREVVDPLRKAGADVTTVIGRPGARSRSLRRTSAVRVECPNPCPET